MSVMSVMSAKSAKSAKSVMSAVSAAFVVKALSFENPGGDSLMMTVEVFGTMGGFELVSHALVEDLASGASLDWRGLGTPL